MCDTLPTTSSEASPQICLANAPARGFWFMLEFSYPPKGAAGRALPRKFRLRAARRALIHYKQRIGGHRLRPAGGGSNRNCPATVRERKRAATVGAIPLSPNRPWNLGFYRGQTGSTQIYPPASPFGDLRERSPPAAPLGGFANFVQERSD